MTRGLKLSACLPRTASRCRMWPTATQSRWFRTTPPRTTDGVFRGLTDDRLPTPWIEAFKLQQAGKGTPTPEGEAQQPGSQERDLSPRRMSDSYHRVILPLGQDPWLSDTYLNSSGHIRLGTMFMDLDALSVRLQTTITGLPLTDLLSRESSYTNTRDREVRMSSPHAIFHGPKSPLANFEFPTQ